MFLTCDTDRWTDRIQNGSSEELRGCGVTATVAVAVAVASGVGIITAPSEHFDNGRIVLEYVYRTYTILYYLLYTRSFEVWTTDMVVVVLSRVVRQSNRLFLRLEAGRESSTS
jgi:hypothetical protein